MGQYYIPTLINANGVINTLNSHRYNNGLKLMERSYIGNKFVNAVCTLLWKNPTRLAWIGDYSDGEEDKCGQQARAKAVLFPAGYSLRHERRNPYRERIAGRI